jgi:superfamily I DNA/RNA helicase
VIAKLRRQLKVIRVDESQNTDQPQIELIASLIEPGHHGLNPRKTVLFPFCPLPPALYLSL